MSSARRWTPSCRNWNTSLPATRSDCRNADAPPREEVIETALAAGETAEEPENPVPNPTIRRTIRVPLKPMSLEEALLQAELEGAPVYMFHDADANRACVLVQVEKGVYDLIEGLG